jgi:hypothetical protein
MKKEQVIAIYKAEAERYYKIAIKKKKRMEERHEEIKKMGIQGCNAIQKADDLIKLIERIKDGTIDTNLLEGVD